ncbi:MAG: MBL fold metallo-hydrolase [Coriobacteriales bacterium]|jgi:glyoxylase-like metal-dependent hydrolase (beta-lactamase superfamily II)|nr:MBL fold metallo-hydrolase [Coriobacteriales bacterium]
MPTVVQIETLTIAVRKFPLFTTNCYLLSDAAEAEKVIIVDPAAEPEKIIVAIGDHQVEALVLTHSHWDHLGALLELQQQTGAPIYAHPSEIADIQAACREIAMHSGYDRQDARIDLAVNSLNDGDTLNLGQALLEILHTPGHSKGSICLWDRTGGQLLSGDTLFAGACGRTDLPSGDPQQMGESLRRLAQLPPETRVYPGHDESTSIGNELKYGALRLASQGIL